MTKSNLLRRSLQLSLLTLIAATVVHAQGPLPVERTTPTLPQQNASSAACIYMGDLNFGTFVLGKDGPKTLPLDICNQGNDSIRFITAPGADSVVNWLSKNYSIPHSTLDSLRDYVVLGPMGSNNSCFRVWVTFTPRQLGAFQTTAHFHTTVGCVRDSSIWRATVIGVSPHITGFDWRQRWLVANPCPIQDSKNPVREYADTIYAFNTGNQDVEVKQIVLLGPDAVSGIFSLDNSDRRLAIQPGDIIPAAASSDTPRLWQRVLFKPNAERIFHCEILLVTTGGDTARSYLDGVGIESHVEVTNLDFGSVPFDPGNVKDSSITIRSTGTRALIVYNVVPENGADFTIESPTPGYPRVLLPGDSLKLRVQFHPSAVGQASTRALIIADHSYCDGLDSTGTITAEASGSSDAPRDRASAERSATISPAPAHDRADLRLTLDRAGDAVITLINEQGEERRRTVHTVAAGANIFPLDLQGLPAGIYYCHILAGATRKVLPLIIVR